MAPSPAAAPPPAPAGQPAQACRSPEPPWYPMPHGPARVQASGKIRGTRRRSEAPGSRRANGCSSRVISGVPARSSHDYRPIGSKLEAPRCPAHPLTPASPPLPPPHPSMPSLTLPSPLHLWGRSPRVNPVSLARAAPPPRVSQGMAWRVDSSSRSASTGRAQPGGDQALQPLTCGSGSLPS